MQRRSKVLRFGLAILGIFIIFSSGIVLFQETKSMGQVNNVEPNFVLSYTTHSPIFIDTNNDFELQGYPGNGSLADPYLISGFNITTTGVCIRIQDTTAHFIIHDCILSGGTANNGIELSYVDNGVIMNNTIFQKYHGIHTNHATDVTIFNNTILDNAFVGIYIYESSNFNTVANNTLTGNYWPGVYVQSSDNNVVANNSITGQTQSGISVLACIDNLIEFNVITDNGGFGVHLSGSWTTTLVNNTISRNNVGVRLHSADFSIISNNTITDNTQGFELSSSTENNTIYLNVIAYNNNNNAVDDGEDNKWNSTTWGNYWSDYVGTGFYNIPGSGGSIDYHPFSYDSKAPTIDHPDDVEYIEGSTGHSITWNATDFHPSHYEILDNETELISHSWSGELITVTIDGFNVGTHIVTIIVHDTFGYFSTDTVIVIVTAQATTTPTTTTTTTLPIDGLSLDTMTVLLIGGGLGVIIAVFVVVRSRRR